MSGLTERVSTKPEVFNNASSTRTGAQPAPEEVKSINTKGGSSSDQTIKTKVAKIVTDGTFFGVEYARLSCFRTKVNNRYKQIKDNTDDGIIANTVDITIKLRDKLFNSGNFDVNEIYPGAYGRVVATDDWDYITSEYENCLRREQSTKNTGSNTTPNTGQIEDTNTNIDNVSPFDRRLYRNFIFNDKDGNTQNKDKVPFSSFHRESATSGYIISEKMLKESNLDNKNDQIQKTRDELNRMKHDHFYYGVPALQNTYALTKLYGAEGGSLLVDRKNERRWYEVDQAIGPGANELAFSKNPTTSSLISWGAGDPYGRTPYHFTDFAFSKHWNRIENNRLITLRRFPAPILDNLKFPGMDGNVKLGTTSDPGKDASGNVSPNTGAIEGGTSGKKALPPMASVITYFGEGTGNKLSEILKFTTGMNWGDVKAEVWQVSTESTPSLESGPGSETGLFGKLTSLSKMLSVAGGDFNPQLIMNDGQLPPDPYTQGPYENRILGPINRIDTVKRREAGLNFTWDGLNLVFEYVNRPIGGVNSKAVILDIMSNFLVLGSASAVFFGGQHRFMGNPAKYPFLGGDKGIEAWYSGKPMEWAGSTVKQFAGQVTNDQGIGGAAKDFFNNLFNANGGSGGLFGAIKGLFTGENAVGKNVLKQQMAEKSAGQIPYLTGMKAMLTGEPVGEWHVTIGNPLNPIAMIGNLICTGIEVELGDELGPDDFPSEIKITVKLDHAMPRDRDGIQSIFNKGMGRIYDLPDSFKGSADGETPVDDYTGNQIYTGTAGGQDGFLANSSKLGRRLGPSAQRTPATNGNTSVWNPIQFYAISPNANLVAEDGTFARTPYRKIDWIAQKSTL